MWSWSSNQGVIMVVMGVLGMDMVGLEDVREVEGVMGDRVVGGAIEN